MFRMAHCGVAILLMVSLVAAAPYSKYGRSCKDIGCLSSQVCVMTEDPCTSYSSDRCGRYPICQSSGNAGAATCTSMICPSGQYCRTQDGRPICVNTVPGSGYDSAGVSTVNGQPSQTNVHHDNPSVSSNQNPNYQNPYANANAPPMPIPISGNDHHVNSGSNLGYPPYPSNNGAVAGTFAGFPPLPSSNNGYRVNSDFGAISGSSSGTGSSSSSSASSNGRTIYGGTNNGYPPYTGQNYPSVNTNNGYPPYNGQNYPAGNTNNGYPPYPVQNYPVGSYGKRNGRNGSSVTTPAISLMLISFAMVAKYFSSF